MTTLYTDIRYGVRSLFKRPGFTLVAVLTLALGIGANTAIFSAVNALLLRPLPVENMERLVYGLAMREGFDPFGTSILEYTAYRERSHSFVTSGLAANRSFNLAEHGNPERVRGAAVLAAYLTTLGVRPVLGRSFNAEEDAAGGPAVALVGYGLWQRRFGGDSGLIGRPLDLEGRSYTVIGIMAPGFDLPAATEIWVPLQLNLQTLPIEQRSQTNYVMVALLKPGTRLDQADAELKGIAQQLAEEYPQIKRGWSYKLIGLRSQLLGDVAGRIQIALYTLLAGVGLLLLICCANVANLMLARGLAHEREIAIRRALGASRWRITRQLLCESMLLALVGGLGGVLLAYWLNPLLTSLSPIEGAGLSSYLQNFQIDRRVLSFALLTSMLTGLIFGLIPAVRTVWSSELMSLMKKVGHRSVQGAGRRWLNALVVAEIAIAMMLLVSGGLLVQSFRRLQQVELGFRPDRLLTMELELSPNRYQDHRRRVGFVEQVLDRIRNIPGVVSAGVTTNIPLSRQTSVDSFFTVEGRPPLNPADVPITSHRLVSPDYLQTLGVTLVKGRLLDKGDHADSLPVVVVSEELARRAWDGEDPIGKRIRRGRQVQANFPWMTVVGVVKDVKEDLFNFRVNRPVWYVPYQQSDNSLPLSLVVQAVGDPASLTQEARVAIFAVDPNQPVNNIMTMKDNLAGVLIAERFSATLMSMLSVLGLALAALGLYGVMAYSVSQRTGELGLRMALGARPTDIFRLVIANGAKLTVFGLGGGLIGALVVTRFLAETLYDVNPYDPWTFAVVQVLLSGVALIACYLPARRATKVDPLVALRYE